MKPSKQHISITLDRDILEKIKLLAQESDRSLSQYINHILKNDIVEHADRQSDRLPSSQPPKPNP
ncbi:MAG: ribbon-helix-helix protein, CopG family [Clostridiales bacterium]|nr:ribbon-helix-helix protein, CopG family [Clostridiales bacterium]